MLAIRKFSRINRVMRYAQKKNRDEIEYKKKVHEENRFVPGMNDLNIDLLAEKEDNTFYPK